MRGKPNHVPSYRPLLHHNGDRVAEEPAEERSLQVLGLQTTAEHLHHSLGSLRQSKHP